MIVETIKKYDKYEPLRSIGVFQAHGMGGCIWFGYSMDIFINRIMEKPTESLNF